MSNARRATVYIQVEPEWGTVRSSDGERTLLGARAVNMTQKRPSRPKPGVVLVRLTLVVPDGAFLPLRPDVVVTIPESMTAAAEPIEVEVGDPTE